MTVTDGTDEHVPATDTNVEAVVVDVDSVVTDTQRIHAEAWKGVLDSFLRARAGRQRASYRPFDMGGDYLAHLAGRPSADGIRSFLASRGIPLTSDDRDTAGRHVTERLGELKDRYLASQLQRRHVIPYPSTVRFLRELRDRGCQLVAAPSDRLGQAIVRATGLGELFDIEVAGLRSPSGLLTAALDHLGQLGLPPAAVAAVSATPEHVRAARQLDFGLVVGVDRSGVAGTELRGCGADVVVRSLTDVHIATGGRRAIP